MNNKHFKNAVQDLQQVFQLAEIDPQGILGVSIITEHFNEPSNAISASQDSMCMAIISALKDGQESYISEKTNVCHFCDNLLNQRSQSSNNQIYVCPIDQMSFTPDAIFINGTPDDIMKLVHASIYESEGVFVPTLTAGCGNIDAHEQLARLDECQIVDFSCLRSFDGINANGEISFTIPIDKLESVLNGLRSIVDNNVYYPNDNIDFSPSEEFTIIWD